MDVREKLVELLENHCSVIGEDNCKASQNEKCTPRDCAICLASNLIVNGVTVQEWISVKDRLPELHEAVLVYTLTHDVLKAHFRGERSFFGHDGIWRSVTHWMPLPQPPKGE